MLTKVYPRRVDDSGGVLKSEETKDENRRGKRI